MSAAATVLVTNGTGNVGRQIVRALLEQKDKFAEVRTAVRDPESHKAKQLAELGAHVVKISYDDPASLVAALNGVDKIAFTTPLSEAHQDNTQRWLAAVDTAKNSGGKLRHIVRLSMASCDDPQFLFAKWHALNEVLIGLAGIPVTFVRSAPLSQNVGSLYSYLIKNYGNYDVPFGDAPTPLIDARDVAKVIVKALLLDGDQIPESYTIRGAENLRPSDVARILSEVVGSPIQYRDITEEQAKEFYLNCGISEAMADSICELHQVVNQKPDLFGLPDSSVKDLTGQEPISFRQYALDNIDRFRSDK